MSDDEESDEDLCSNCELPEGFDMNTYKYYVSTYCTSHYSYYDEEEMAYDDYKHGLTNQNIRMYAKYYEEECQRDIEEENELEEEKENRYNWIIADEDYVKYYVIDVLDRDGANHWENSASLFGLSFYSCETHGHKTFYDAIADNLQSCDDVFNYKLAVMAHELFRDYVNNDILHPIKYKQPWKQIIKYDSSHKIKFSRNFYVAFFTYDNVRNLMIYALNDCSNTMFKIFSRFFGAYYDEIDHTGITFANGILPDNLYGKIAKYFTGNATIDGDAPEIFTEKDQLNFHNELCSISSYARYTKEYFIILSFYKQSLKKYKHDIIAYRVFANDYLMEQICKYL